MGDKLGEGAFSVVQRADPKDGGAQVMLSVCLLPPPPPPTIHGPWSCGASHHHPDRPAALSTPNSHFTRHHTHPHVGPSGGREGDGEEAPHSG